MNRFQDKVAVVTGAGSGIGRATSIALAREGARVACVDIDETLAKETSEMIQKEARTSMPARVDVTKSNEVRALVESVASKYGRIDILFNGAGIIKFGDALETTEEDWDAVLSVNLNGAFFFSKFTVEQMIRSGQGGSIVNTSSVSGLAASKRCLSYCTSKAAVIMLTKALATDYGEYGIRVNCICPGPTMTPMFERVLKSYPTIEQGMAKEKGRTLLKRIASAEEIANVVLFLVSQECSYITGSTIVVDAGMTVHT